ncbi:MAG: hypothetical protein KHX61_05850, partial [Proteobacteria bacterium]|nr:hypothetical protein [Pseudomonadota bacterium]
ETTPAPKLCGFLSNPYFPLSFFSSYLLIENKNRRFLKRNGGGAEKLHVISQPYSPYKYAYVGHSTTRWILHEMFFRHHGSPLSRKSSLL